MALHYLFIDGGFFESFIADLKQVVQDTHGDRAVQIDLAQVGSGYDRVFYYDAYPERRPKQSADEFERVMEERRQHFAEIASTPKFNVRPALTRRGERQQQKGVDVLLAIECLMHAIRNDIDEATVYTSDLDFFPLFEALLQSKTRSHLGYQIGKTSLELIQAADYAEPLTFVDFNSWLSGDTKFHTGSVSMSQSQLNEFRPIGSGTVAGKAFELKKHDRMGRYAAFVEGKRIGPSMKSRLYEEGEVEKRFKAKINYTTSPE